MSRLRRPDSHNSLSDDPGTIHAHEIRNLLGTATFAYQALKRGTVPINGSTGAALGRSLSSLRTLVNSSLADTRLAGNHQQCERVLVSPFLEDIAVAAHLEAESRDVPFAYERVAPELAVNVDRQLLGSAVMNLLNNAFKFTPANGHVVLRAFEKDSRLQIEVEDQCGGLVDSEGDPFRPFAERRGSDRSGLGLGLSIARKAVREHGGDISIRNIPGTGCVFVIDVPLLVSEAERIAHN